LACLALLANLVYLDFVILGPGAIDAAES
jgi:hypothetical protein